MISKFIFSLTLFILMTSALLAQQTIINDADRQPIDKDVYHGYLPNGLAYYVRKNSSPKKRAVLYLVERAGSLQEDDDQKGLAHFVEHMAFKGTRTFPKNELISYLQKSGVKFGADVNAHTGFNQTSFELVLPTDSMEVFNKGLDILTDWAGFVTFDPAEINNERGVILEEARIREKTANGRMNSQTISLEYNNSRFAERLPIGNEDIIKNAKPETIVKFYHDWYRPDEQAVIIVGDVNPRQVVQLLKEKFSVLQNPASERPLVNYSIQPVNGTRLKILKDKETPYTYFSMTVRLPGTKERTNDEYMQRLKTFLLNYMLNGRISEIAKKGNPPFLAASAYHSTSIGNTDIFTTRINSKPGELESSIKTIMAELERAKKFGFTEDEFKTAKDWFVRGRASSYFDMQNHPSASYADEYRRNFLEDEGIPGLEYEYTFTSNNIKNIRLADINNLMIPFTSDQNRVILLEAPENDAATLPDEKTLLSWIDHSDVQINAYQDVQVDKNADILSDDNLNPGKIDSSTSDDVAGTETLMLSNGANDASNFTFVFVGNTDKIGMRGLIKKYIGSLPGNHSNQSFKDLKMNPPAGRITKIIHKGIDDKSTVELLFHGEFEYGEANNLQLNALGEILQIKLIQRLRQQENEVYTPKAGAYYSNYPGGQYGINIQFTCSSANVDKLIDATLDEINKTKQNGASPVDIQKFIADETRSTQLKLKQNGFWVDHLSSAYRNKENPGYIMTYISTLNNVTVESTKATANKYLNNDNFIKLILLPENNK